MLTISANTRLFFCQTPAKMHKSFEGLSAIVEKMFPGELLKVVVQFSNHSSKRDKVVPIVKTKNTTF